VEPLGPVTRTLESASPEATLALGVALGAALEAGDFVGLAGQLGAGKTLLARGVARGAGVDPGEVSSPTYSIVQSYQGRVTLHHADLYRLRSEDDLFGTGYHELLGGPGALLVEWYDQVPGAVPEDGLLVHLEVAGPEARRLTARALGPRGEALLARWARGSPPAGR
jgi:tRNA threonylcarbamoyladenosine biosynthesis protein TsaE